MQDPQRAASVFAYMAEHRKQLPTWMNGSISTEDFLMTDGDHDAGRVMMVDVGGGAGHQCLALREAFPNLKGKMLVQDIVSGYGIRWLLTRSSTTSANTDTSGRHDRYD